MSLRRAAHLAFFRRAPQAAAGVRASTLVVLFLLTLSLSAIIDFLVAGQEMTFNEYGIVRAFAEAAVFAGAIIVAGGRTAALPLSRALADFLAIIFLFRLLTLDLVALYLLPVNGFGQLDYYRYAAWTPLNYLLMAWLYFAMWRAGRQLWNGQLRLAGLRFAAAGILPLLLVPFQPIVLGYNSNWQRLDAWHLGRSALLALQRDTGAQETSYRDPPPQYDIEAALYRQPKLIDEALAGLRPSPKNQPQIYFVGMAASDAQDVFRREVISAQDIMGERFGTSGRSVLLINSYDTIARTALASRTNLELILEGIGKAMDRRKDVLVLFITSHGSKGLLSVTAPGFSLNQITPDWLAQALKKSAIKHKVLILSACHAGSFIPALSDADTLILTAAHADRTSFGCSNERDWTYFGDALFNYAFKNTRSFPDAFAEAKKLIEKWEGEQGLTPSDPQIFAGSAITEMLKAFPFPSPKSTPDVARPPIAAQIADDDFRRGLR